MKVLKGRKNLLISLALVLLVCGCLASTLVYREVQLNQVQQEALQELDENRGEYAEGTLVLYDTSLSSAQQLAKELNATLRITSDGKFATLTLKDGTTVEQVYNARSNRKYLSELSLDYKVKTSDVEASSEPTGKTVGEPTEEDTEEQIKQPSRPDYDVTDTYYAQQGYLDYLNIGSAWNMTKGGGITVAVIDTGIDTDHPEFAGKISEYSYNATEDKIVKDYVAANGGYDWSLIEDVQGHGTAVAGTIAASMDGSGTIGIAPEVTLLVIKAECDQNGAFYNSSDLVFGLYYAIERDVDVVNMSFGGYGDNPCASATKLAVDSDIICVAAAGNDATTALCYPAADENVLGVGALTEDGWELANYSNYGENVNLVAPGTVYTAKKGGEYGTIQGTSFSAPITAAAVALYLSRNRYQTFANVQELLYASCYDLGSLGEDWYYGYGALDIGALICEEKGTVTFDYLTDEIEETTQVFVRSHTLQNLPEPERNYAVFDGWYYDIHCTEELNWYEDEFFSDLTLYANWVNEDDGVPYTYVTKSDGTIEIRSYTGHRRYITIPDMIDGKPVTSIGDFAFKGQSRLRQVNLPSTLTYIGISAFENCNNLLEIAIPDGVTEIGEYAFYNNVRLSNVAFTDKSALKTIGDFAFAYCGKLTRVEIPKNVTALNGSAFYGATSLKAISVIPSNKSFTSVDGVLLTKTESTLLAYPAGLSGKYDLPSKVENIGAYAFGYTKLKTIDFGKVSTIGGCAFSYSALETVTIPDTVTSLGSGAFECSFNLNNLSLGSRLKSIPYRGFADCSSLDKVEIPANIREIGIMAFFCGFSLTELTFSEDSKLTLIDPEAFFKTNLRTLKLPSSLVVIGEGAFSCCYALGEVTFEANSNLQIIDSTAFACSVNLEKITFPDNLLQIGSYAFQETALANVTLPKSLINLGAGAFASCHSLVTIDVEEGNVYYKSVNGVVYNYVATEIVAYPAGTPSTYYAIEDTVTAIGDAAFYGAWNLTSVGLPSKLQTVKSYGFYDCESITAYTLPESLTYIEDYAFSDNVSLGFDLIRGNKLNIPDNVIQIGRYAFAGDYNLNYINFTENSKLPRISYKAFAETG